jgi:uncharacterized protein (TIGR02996 family)
MTEEQFLRAIADRPGDDVLRMAYADWLEVQSDVRSVYVHAEMKAHRSGNGSMPKDLVGGYDPVWMARVSRPPFGVCCSHLRLSATGETNRPEDIDAAGKELGVKLPPQLRALLLNYNIGRLRGGPYILPCGGEPGNRAVDAIVCMTDPDFDDDLTSHELVDRTVYLRDESEVPDRFVYLAELHDEAIVVSCRKSDAGAVLYWNGFEQRTEKLADTIGDFLATLVPKMWPLTEVDITSEP